MVADSGQLSDDNVQRMPTVDAKEVGHVLKEEDLGLVRAREPNDVEEEVATLVLKPLLLSRPREGLAREPGRKHVVRWHCLRGHLGDITERRLSEVPLVRGGSLRHLRAAAAMTCCIRVLR